MINENRAVARLSELFALYLGIKPNKARQIRNAASLHDIGKQHIEKSILNKKGRLAPEEFEIIKTHTEIGAQMLSSIKGELGIMARSACLYHHEWYNGGGYMGIPTSKLPYYIPIISISDVFVACCSNRCYKDAWPPEQVLEYLQNQAGTQFSYDIVKKFISLVRESDDVATLFLCKNCL